MKTCPECGKKVEGEETFEGNNPDPDGGMHYACPCGWEQTYDRIDLKKMAAEEKADMARDD